MIALRIAEVMEFKESWQLDIVRFAMIHDAEEAWVGDIASPMKRFMQPDAIPIDQMMGVWYAHFDAPSEVKRIVKIADLAADVLYLLDHGRTPHAVMVREEIHDRLVAHVAKCEFAPGDQESIWRILLDLFARDETYIDDYL